MGLLGSIAKTAVVSGTATVTRNAVNRRQAEKNVRAYSDAQHEGQGEQVTYTKTQQAPPPPQQDVVSQLERLAALKEQGILTDEEFQAQKAKILGT